MNPTKWFYNGLLALLAVAALLLWQVKLSLPLWQLAKQSTDMPKISGTPSTPHFVPISNYHLFGAYSPKSTDKDDAPLSSLNFTVMGIFLADPQQHSTVLLDLGDGKGKSYKVGDSLQGDVKLYKIEKDAVVIERDGRYETIPLDKETLHFEPKAEPLPLEPHD